MCFKVNAKYVRDSSFASLHVYSVILYYTVSTAFFKWFVISLMIMTCFGSIATAFVKEVSECRPWQWSVSDLLQRAESAYVAPLYTALQISTILYLYHQPIEKESRRLSFGTSAGAL